MTGTHSRQSQSRAYLDCNATMPLIAEARAAAQAAFDLANPSSVHSEGRAARALVEEARRAVADLLGANPGEMTFTSGATEAAATALTPHWLVNGAEKTHARLAVVETDHPAIREGGQFDPSTVTRLAVDRNGVLRLDHLDRWLEELGGAPAVLALTLGNSETGVLQPLPEIVARLSGHEVRLVVDAVQVAGRLPLAIAETGADVVILSGHKLGALAGIGAMVLGDTATRPLPLIRGGGQEKGRRAGTENVSAIASFGAAARAAAFALRNDDGAMVKRRDAFETGLRRRCPQVVILGEDSERLPNTSAIHHAGLRAETVQIALDLAGFAVSAGSACSSGKIGRSHVVAAMAEAGLPVDPGQGAIRVSISRETPMEDLDRFVETYGRLADKAELKDKAA